MGNKFVKRVFIDDRYTRPQGLYQHRNIDLRKLRRLILNGQLAPCFPGVEEAIAELDECPICFLSYPSLNRSKCCNKSICTECYLQVKSPHSARPIRCPFCKTTNYLVEYRGAKTIEEKDIERVEEQKVIEAKIRIQQEELRDAELRMLRRDEERHSEYLGNNATRDQILGSGNSISYSAPLSQPQEYMESADGEPGSPENMPHIPGSSYRESNREEDYDLELEEIMLMEALWLSAQEQGQLHEETVSHQLGSSNLNDTMNNNSVFDQAIATMAQRQVGNNETGVGPSRSHVVSDSNNKILDIQTNQSQEDADEHTNGWPVVPSRRMFPPGLQRKNRASMSDWMLDSTSEAVDAGTSLSSSAPSASDALWESPDFHASQNAPAGAEATTQTLVLPESFEEQIKLAIVLSLADAQSQSGG